MKKYYHTKEDNINRFYTQDGFTTDLIEFVGKEIKYKFFEVFIPENIVELKFWEYNKLINSLIFNK